MLGQVRVQHLPSLIEEYRADRCEYLRQSACRYILKTLRSQLYCETIHTCEVERGQVRNFAEDGFSVASLVSRVDVEGHFTTLF